jgi:hypothetical protein
LYWSSVSLPEVTAKTIGFVPFCCGGKRSCSRSVASWLPVPGRDTLLLVRAPSLPTAPKTMTSMRNQIPMMISGLRAHSMPSLWSSRAIVFSPHTTTPPGAA